MKKILTLVVMLAVLSLSAFAQDSTATEKPMPKHKTSHMKGEMKEKKMSKKAKKAHKKTGEEKPADEKPASDKQ